MLNLVHAELFKLKKSLSLKVCFILVCICAAAIVYISHCIAVGSMSESVSGSASGLTEIVIISLLGSLLAGVLVCSDFETKAIHDAVACGKGRLSVVLSKMIIYLLIMTALLLPYLLSTIIGVCTGAEFSKPFVASLFINILSKESGLGASAGEIGKIILITLSYMLVSAARLSVCIPVAFKVRKTIAVMAFGFVFNALIDLLINAVDDVPVLRDIIKFTPYNRQFLSLSTNLDAGLLIKSAIVSVIFLAAVTGITYALFRKAEIK